MRINYLMEKETDTFSLFILRDSPFPFDPFCFPASYPALNPFGPFPPTLLYSDLRFPEIAGASEIASDVHPL